MPLPRPAVLLDLDGTLVDSLPGITKSVHATLRHLGHEPEPALDLAFVIGPPLEDAMAILLARHGDDRVRESVTVYREHYGAVGMYESRAYAGVPESLAALAAAGFALYVATSKRSAFARPMLEQLGLARWMAGVYGAEPGGVLDHKPQLIAHLLSSEKIASSRAVMVGDRRFDISGAHANGLRAIGALWGYGSRAELTQAGADALAARPEDLFDAVAALSSRG